MYQLKMSLVTMDPRLRREEITTKCPYKEGESCSVSGKPCGYPENGLPHDCPLLKGRVSLRVQLEDYQPPVVDDATNDPLAGAVAGARWMVTKRSWWQRLFGQ